MLNEVDVLDQKHLHGVSNLEFGQHGNWQSLVYFLSVAVGVLLEPGETEPLIAPVLSEVAVHRIVLEEDDLFVPSKQSAGWYKWILHHALEYSV